jgi:hypothetical protein
MVDMTLIGQKSSLNKFSRYIKRCKSSWKRVKPSRRRDMIRIMLITISKLEMKFGFTLVRRGLKEKTQSLTGECELQNEEMWSIFELVLKVQIQVKPSGLRLER